MQAEFMTDQGRFLHPTNTTKFSGFRKLYRRPSGHRSSGGGSNGSLPTIVPNFTFRPEPTPQHVPETYRQPDGLLESAKNKCALQVSLNNKRVGELSGEGAVFFRWKHIASYAVSWAAQLASCVLCLSPLIMRLPVLMSPTLTHAGNQFSTNRTLEEHDCFRAIP
jgi:hypothetical protein